MNIVSMIRCVAVHGSWRTCRLLGMMLGLAYACRRRAEHQRRARYFREWFPHLSEKEARRISRRTTQMTTIILCEQMRLPAATAQELRDYVRFEGVEHLHAAAADGRGIVAPIAHFGQFEMMCARLAQQFAVTAPAGELPSPVGDYVVEARQAAGVATFPPEGAARRALAELRAKKLVAIMADFSANTRHLQMQVLGRLRWVLTSPARLALATGAPLVPMFPVRCDPWLTDGSIVIKVWPPMRLNSEVRRGSEEYCVEVQHGTRYFLEAFEETVRAHPDEMMPWVTIDWE